MDTNAKVAVLAAGLHPGCYDRVIDDAQGVTNLINETASGRSQPDAARVSVEENHSKVFFQRSDPLTDARLAGAERLRSAMEAKMIGDSQGLDQRDHWDAQTKVGGCFG